MYKLNQKELQLFNNIINDIGDTLTYLRDLENQNISLSNELKKIKSDSSKLSDELIKFKDKKQDIIKKCTNFLKNKDRLISFMDFQTRFKEQYNKISKSNSNSNDKNYNESLLGFIYYKHKVDDFNIKQNYDSTCNNIVNLMDIEKLNVLSGGTKQKFIKLINNISGKSINSTITQIVGKNNVFDNLEDYINKIVEGKYQPRSHDNSMGNELNCNNNNNKIIDNINNYNILDNTDDDSQYIRRIFCRNGTEEEEARKSFVFLNFKKQFNNTFTDIFIQKYLSEMGDLLNYLCHYVYFALDFGIRQLLKSLNEIYKLENKNKLTDSDLYIIYKSGNTTNIILKKYMPNFKPSISDLDYYVSIDYDTILTKINNTKVNRKHKRIETSNIENWVEQTIIVVMHDIKNTISEHLHSTYQNDTRFARGLLTTYFNDIKTKTEITKFIKEYNNTYYNFKKPSITKIDITKIITYDTIITKDEQIKYEKAFDETKHKNVIINTTDDYKKSIYIKGIKNFYKNIFLLEENINNNVYGIYIKNLQFKRPYGTYILGVYRLKINNKLEFMCNTQSKKINVPIELIDVSLCRYNSKLVKIKRFKKNENADLIDYYQHKLDKTDMKIQMRMPSPEYMYMDLANLLFLQSIYIWDDLKYLKRVTRLFQMIFAINAKNKTLHKCKSNLTIFRDTINILQKKNNISDKLYYLINNYKPTYEVVQHKEKDFSEVKFPKLQQGAIDFYLDNIIEKHINHLIILNNLTQEISDNTEEYKYWESIKENIKHCNTSEGINIVNILEKLKINIEIDKLNSKTFEELLLTESKDIINLCDTTHLENIGED